MGSLTASLYEACVVSQSEGRKEGSSIYISSDPRTDSASSTTTLRIHLLSPSILRGILAPGWNEHQLVAPKATEYMIPCSIQFASEINIPSLSLLRVVSLFLVALVSRFATVTTSYRGCCCCSLRYRICGAENAATIYSAFDFIFSHSPNTAPSSY